MFKVYPITIATRSYLKTYNCYLIQQGDHLILIDAGVDSDLCWEAFQTVFIENGFSLDALEAIILTHHHDDHIGLVNRIRAQKDVPVYVHPAANKRLRKDEMFLYDRYLFFKRLYQTMGSGTDSAIQLERLYAAVTDKSKQIYGSFYPLDQGDTVYGLQVITVPGHSPDHIALYEPRSRTMFVGDLVISHTSSNAIVDVGEQGERLKTLVAYEQSLKKILTYDVAIAYAGHGNTIHEFAKTVERKLLHIERKGEKIIDLLHTPQTAASMAQILYPEKYQTMFYFIMSEVIGHLDRLEWLGKVRKTMCHGTYYYQHHNTENKA